MIRSLRERVRQLIGEERTVRELFKGSAIGFFMKLAGLACAQLFALAVARIMGADAFGIFSLSISLLTIFAVLGAGGLDVGLLRFIAADSAKGSKEAVSSNYISALLIAVPLSLVITLLSWHFSSFIASNIFHKPDLSTHFKIASLGILPMVLIKINSQGLRGLKEITKYTFIGFVSRYFFGVILLIPFYYFIFYNDLAVMTSFVVALVVIACLSFYWIIPKIDFRNIHINWKRYKIILAVSLPLLLASSLQFIKGWIDTLMLGYFMENSSVGIYNVALKLAALVRLIITAVNIIAAPKFAETHATKNKNELNDVISHSTKLIFWGSLPIFLILFLFPDLILYLFGEEFQTGSTALMILSVGYLVSATSGSVGYIMQMTGKQIAFQNITLVTAILGVVLNYILIPIWGINGAAISTSISVIFWNVISTAYLKIRYGLTTYFNPFSAYTK